MNNFAKALTASSANIRESRAQMVSEDAFDAQSELIRDIKKRKRELDKKLMSLSDLSRDSELSLKVVKDSFNAVDWVKSIQETKLELANIEVELTIAESTFNEYFANEQV